MKLEVFAHRHATILTLGSAIPWGGISKDVFTDTAATALLQHGLEPTLLRRLLLPSLENNEGFQQVLWHPNDWGNTRADGIVLSVAGQSMAAAVRDCTSLVVVTEQGLVGYGHCHRAGLVPDNAGNNVVSNLLAELSQNEPVTQKWQAYLLMGICGNCFEHTADHAHVAQLRFISPDCIRPVRPGLVGVDIPCFVRDQLVMSGFTAANVHHDRVCTHEDPLYGSKRRNRTGRHNLVIVSKH